MAIGPPKTVASAGKDRMMGLGATPAPTKPNQAGAAGVKCGSCGHYHKPGSICSNKSVDGVLDLLKANPYHEEKGKPNGGQFAKKPMEDAATTPGKFDNSDLSTGPEFEKPAGGPLGPAKITKTPVVHSGGQGTGDGVDDGKPDDPNKVSTSEGVKTSDEASAISEDAKEKPGDRFRASVAETQVGAKRPAGARFRSGAPSPGDANTEVEQGTVAGAGKKGNARQAKIRADREAASQAISADFDKQNAEDFQPLKNVHRGPKASGIAPETPQDLQEQKARDQLATLMGSPQKTAFESDEKSRFNPANQAAMLADPSVATANSPSNLNPSDTSTYDRLVKEEKYGKTFDRASKQGFSPEESHLAASQATGGHSQAEGWQSPNQKTAAAKELKSQQAAQAAQVKQAAKDQKSQQAAQTKATALQAKQDKASAALQGKEDKANAKQLIAGARQSLDNSDKQAKLAEAGAAKRDKVLGKESNQEIFGDLDAANSSMGDTMGVQQEHDQVFGGQDPVEPDDLSSMIGPSGQSKMSQQREESANAASISGEAPSIAPTSTAESKQFAQAGAAIDKQSAAAGKPGAAGAPGKPVAAPTGSTGKPAQQGSRGGTAFSQMYGAGAGMGTAMTQEAGAAGPTSAFAAQRTHQLLNPNLRKETAPTMAGTGTGARTNDRHAGGSTSAVPVGQGAQKSIETLLGK